MTRPESDVPFMSVATQPPDAQLAWSAEANRIDATGAPLQPGIMYMLIRASPEASHTDHRLVFVTTPNRAACVAVQSSPML
mmetsp:Transcript_93318/g.263861  ORF Transcript_93318/g.263861 Transcript_93318/m.263861 type:complete len:81 (-) Transcript_93318:216-458(-)